MKLSARQTKFLTLVSCISGLCPWDMPKGGPYLKNHEIKPLIKDGLIAWKEKTNCWDITRAGKKVLASLASDGV